jgi:endonuclease/exonuclease/phosphatase family metal-dependent hydrolase
MKKYSFFLLLMIFTGTAMAQHFIVGTYNMRNDNNKDDAAEGNGWQTRYPVIASMLRFHQFDIFGTQECMQHQLEDIKNSLPGFDYIGIGRDDGKQAGEHSAIFYNTQKFTLLDKGDFWLSTITDRPNKGWDAVLPRICSWGKFKENKTGFTFYFFNLHMDHVGVQARAESAKLVLSKLKEMAGDTPAILTGDFNVDQTSESYKLINNSGVFRDAYETADVRYALNGTFNGFKPDSKTDSRIDHIFFTKQFRVTRYGILTDSYRSQEGKKSVTTREPSDHFPVLAEASFGQE